MSSNNDNGIPRVEYRKVKAFNRVELSAYLERIWMRGYKKGKEDALGINKTDDAPDENTTEAAE